VDHCFVVFHYGSFPESTVNLKSAGVSLHGLCTWWDVLEVAATRNYTADQINTVKDFLNDPDSWADQNKLS
jgi:orotate phosphoribosyltransferase